MFSVAVNVLCHVAVCVPPPPFSSGLGTGNGGVIFKMFTVWLIFYLILICFTYFDVFLFILLDINNFSYARLDKQNLD